jgi:hypothetical protein
MEGVRLAGADSASKSGLPAIPGIVVAMLPTLTCALCWPAYAGLLSSLGLGFLGSAAYLLPLTGGFLVIALAGLAMQTKRRGYRPLVLGVVSAALIVAGKFALESNLITYGGIGLLVAATVWTMISSRRSEAPTCAACAAGPPDTEQTA